MTTTMTTTMKSLVLLLLSLLHTIIAATSSGTVISLTTKNFDTHLTPTTPTPWLLKFYAPWCSHCQTLAPITTTAAARLSNKLQFGKIDCTVEKTLCKRFDVRGYPTLKYYWEGEFYDYTFGRDVESFVKFGKKMSESAVKIVRDGEGVYETLVGEEGVAFVVYDNVNAESSVGEDEESLLQATERTRVFNQVARKFQATGTFGLLSPSIPSSTIASILNVESSQLPSGFIARVEQDVPTQFFTTDNNDNDSITAEALSQFVKETNVPTLSELGGHNFRFVSRRGKPIVIGAYNPADAVKSSKFRHELKQYAVGGKYKDQYIFGMMDGVKWDKFISQFGVTKEGMPELVILDVPERTYWQDSSIFTISEFIQAVQNGEIEGRIQEKKSHNPLEEFSQLFIAYMPWSLFAMLTLFVVVFWLALPSSEPMLPVVPERGEKEESMKEDESKKDR